MIWDGNKYFTGLNDFFSELEEKNYKIQNRVLLSRYRGKTKCNTCKGKRLRPEANYITVGGKMVSDLVELMSKKGLVKKNGPVTIKMTKKGELCIKIDEDFTQEFTGVYCKHVLAMLPPITALMKVMKVQQEDMEELQAKWFLKPEPTLGEPADFDDFI